MTKAFYEIGGTLFVVSGSAILKMKGRFSNSGYCVIGLGTSLFINGMINEEIALPDDDTNYEECLQKSQKICNRLLMNTSIAIAAHLIPFSLNFISFSERNKRIVGCFGTFCSSFALTQLLDTCLHLSNLEQTIIQTRASFQRRINVLTNQGNDNDKSNVVLVISVFATGFVVGFVIKNIYDKFKRSK